MTAVDEFLGTVEQLAGVDRPRAERATRATLQTLAERLSAGEARELASELPPELAGLLGKRSGPEPFRVDEFLRRVAEREGVDVETAERDARAVFAALGRTVSEKEIHDVVAELPQDFAPLVADAARRFVRVIPYERFLEHARAEELDAVLGTLAERLSPGEVDDLIAVLPIELHPALRRGRDVPPQRVSLDEFLRRVGSRLNVTPLEARSVTRRVFEALREAVPHEEFVDVVAELPAEFSAVGVRP